MKLRALAPAKVNLCLFLGPTREIDGRHEMVTLYESLSLSDQLEMTARLEPGASDRVVCEEIEGENLVERALRELRSSGWAGPPVEVQISKRIPIAAGMAGGSADAAAALRLAAATAPIPPGELDRLAASLGADVPAQLVPGVALGTGAGEVVQRRPPLAPHGFVVVPSTQRLSTPEVFREADRLGLPRTGEELAAMRARVQEALDADGRLPGELIVNDLQPAAASLCPAIDQVLAEVREVGAHHALVSGSGPTVVGLWWGAQAETLAARAAEELSRRHPGTQAAHPVGADAAMPEMI